MEPNEKHLSLPVPGQRILRSVAAVWLCFGVYLLRGRHGIPFYSAIAVLQCMQPYNKSMRSVARKRLIGTGVGAVWGLAALLLELGVMSAGVPDEVIHYLLVGLFTGAVLYSTVLLKVTEASYFSAVVFLSVAVNHIGDANPYVFVFNRVLDTVIGVILAEIVNRLHLPRRRNRDVLFVSGINDTIFGTGKKLSPYAKVELNRLVEEGALFTISTTQTPATVRELLPDVDLRLPIIAMDGACLYDLKKMEYLKTVTMEEAAARRMMAFLEPRRLAFFTNTIQDHLLVVHYGELGDGALRQLYERIRKSPYRNFVQRQEDSLTDVLYFMILDESEKVERLKADIEKQPWAGSYRVVYDDSKRFDGCTCLKIYAREASREAMLEELKRRIQPRQVVTFGSIPGRYDVLIQHADKDRMVKELKRRFSPVDLRCWNTVFRL